MNIITKTFYFFLIISLFFGCTKQETEDVSLVQTEALEFAEDQVIRMDTDPNGIFLESKKGPSSRCCYKYNMDISPQGVKNNCCTYKIFISNNNECNMTLTDLNGNILMTVLPLTSNVYTANVCSITQYQVMSGESICETITLGDDCNILGDECCDIHVIQGDFRLGDCCGVEFSIFNYGGCPLVLTTSGGLVKYIGSQFDFYSGIFEYCGDDVFYLHSLDNWMDPCFRFELDDCYEDE